MTIKHNYTATGVNNTEKQVSVDRWNESHRIVGDVPIEEDVVGGPPANPPSGTTSLYTRRLAGKQVLANKGPDFPEVLLQASLGGNKIGLWIPPGNSTTVPGVFGMAALTALGTATARNVATTNSLTRMTRVGYVSSATAGSLTGVREAILKHTTGGGGVGGFFIRYRFCVSDAAAVAGARMFIGLSASSAAPTNVNPATLLNVIGLVQLDSGTNFQFYNAGSTVGTPVDLGGIFNGATRSTDGYELCLYSSSINGGASYQVTKLSTGETVSGACDGNIPTNLTLLCHQLWRTNNTTALAVGLDICSIYVETDN